MEPDWEEGGTRRALLIGIDRYRGNARSLRGCVADVLDMRSLLEEHFRFAPANVMTVIDEAATRRGILDGIARLAAEAQPSDTVVIHFSGHGSYCWQEDGVREGALVAHDSRAIEAGDIGGAELGAALRGMAARKLAVILDCCHSGNLLLSRAAGTARFLPPAAAPRAEEEPRAVRPLLAGAPFVVLAGAGPSELANEGLESGVHRGAFTFALVREARRVAPGATYRDLIESVREAVAARHPFQHPQLEGVQADYAIFGDAQLIPRPYLLASPGANGTVRLRGGSVTGVTVGSQYAVYAPGARLDGEENAVAEIEVVQTGIAHSEAQCVAGGPIQPASRAVETLHAHEGPVVRVGVLGLRELNATLAPFAHLRLIHSSVADWDIRARAERRGALIEVDCDGIQVRVEEAGPRAAFLAAVEKQILHWARWLNLLRLDEPRSTLRVELTVEGPRTVSSDGALRCRIANRSECPLYVALLALCDDGAIDLVLPVEGSRRLEPGEVVSDTFDVRMNDSRPVEMNYLKLLAATEECDFRIVTMPAARAPADSNLSALEQLLAEAAAGSRPLVRRFRAQWTARLVKVEVRRALGA